MEPFRFKYLSVSVFVFSIGLSVNAQTNVSEISDYNKLSEEFLANIKNDKSTNEIRAQLYSITLEKLEEGLKNDNEKLAFWINIYNVYILVILSENPDKYNDRGAFFKNEQIPIAGRLVSFAKIEHGIIRKSQWELGLGKISKWFPDKFERKLRVDERDYRIHFALNCGAKDCPPVAIYEVDRLEEQLKKGTKNYLERTSKYKPEANEVAVTSIFSWFRGDFGSKNGVMDILKENKVIPITKNIGLAYKNYDWTLNLENWTEL